MNGDNMFHNYKIINGVLYLYVSNMNEISSFNNTENEDYIKLSDEEIDKIAENIVDEVMLDNELNRVITDTIEWYVNHELYKDEENEDEDREIPLF